VSEPSVLLHYWFTKMTCSMHGKYTARTHEKPTRPVPCPECVAGWVLEGQCRGCGKNEVPFVSKPRIPQDTKNEFIHSKKATLRKRSRAT
jgi:hypothetical protein